MTTLKIWAGNSLSGVVISELGSYRCSGKNEMPASAVHKPEKSIVNMNNGRLQNAAMSDVSSPRIGINEASGKGSAIAATLASINGSRVHTTPKEQDVAAKEEVAGSSLIPTTKQMVDYFRQGRLIEGGVGYRQTLVVRSYEVGADKTATIDTFLNLFQPRRSDLDMNNHVNNVKYVGWMLETAPEWVLESHELCCITLEYRRECGRSDVVQSLCQPEDSTENISVTFPYSGTDSPHALASELLETNGLLGLQSRLRYSHLLRMQGESKNEEIVRGRTVWRRKSSVPAKCIYYPLKFNEDLNSISM